MEKTNPFPPSFGFTDKRVDKILVKNGYDLKNCEIFYSPITVVFYFLTLLFGSLFTGFIISNFSEILPYLKFAGIYFVLVYLCGAYTNTSIAISDKELFFINPNFPFGVFQKYDFNKIENIRIAKSKNVYWFWVFGTLSGNFIEIKTDSTIEYKLFYCTNLNMDTFDENMTDRTIDDLHYTLKQKGIKVDFELE